jgi:hypothetical protein
MSLVKRAGCRPGRRCETIIEASVVTTGIGMFGGERIMIAMADSLKSSIVFSSTCLDPPYNHA